MAKKIERIKMVKAMEFIARQINDEEIFEEWLMDGVADGEIRYGDLDVTDDDLENLEYYIGTQNEFADLMALFVRVIYRARKSGGLYCDGVVDSNK